MNTALDFRRSLVQRIATTRTHYGRRERDRNVLEQTPLPLDPLPERFGVYLIAPGDNATVAGVLDFDNHGDSPVSWDRVVEIAQPVVKHLRALGYRPMAFRSTGGRGLHVWLVWDDPQPAARVRQFFTDVVEACGLDIGDGGIVLGRVEVFPKQDDVPADGWGTCIDPPLAGQSVPLDPKTLAVLADVPLLITSPPLPDRVPPAEKTTKRRERWDLTAVQSALAAIPADDYADWVTVLRALRGGAARARLREEEARAIAEEWSRRSAKHTDREFSYKWERGFKKDAAGRGRSLASLFWLAETKYGWQRPAPPCVVERVRIQESDPKLYLVTIVDHPDREVPMRAHELSSKTLFVNKVLEAIDRVVEPPRVTDLNRLLADAERLPADDDATQLGQFRGHLLRYLDEAMHPDREELRLENRAWRDEKTGRTWFKWRDFESWMRRQRHFDVKHTEALHFVRAIGGDTGVVNLGDYGSQRAWWVPLDPRSNVPEPGAVAIADDAAEAPY